MIRWLEDEKSVTSWVDLGEVGQSTPATEGTVKEKLSTVEKILLASVVISGVGLVVHLWEIFGRGSSTGGQDAF